MERGDAARSNLLCIIGKSGAKWYSGAKRVGRKKPNFPISHCAPSVHLDFYLVSSHGLIGNYLKKWRFKLPNFPYTVPFCLAVPRKNP